MEVGLGILTAGATQQSGSRPTAAQAAWKDAPSETASVAIQINEKISLTIASS
jgi:hypothetical protein